MSEITNNPQNDPSTEAAAANRVEIIFHGELFSVATRMENGNTDGKLYVAEMQNGAPGKVHMIEPVYSEEDFERAEAVTVAYAKFLDLRQKPPVRDEKGANSAIIRRLNPQEAKN